MTVALFIPCYIDAVYPEVGIATLRLLERLGVTVDYPPNQICCGQPMANEGDQHDSAPVEQHFVDCFRDYEYIVAPSGSCVSHVRHYLDAVPQTTAVQQLRRRTFELVEFITDILHTTAFPWAAFPYPVAIHNSCSAIRSLQVARPTESMAPHFDKTADLLRNVKGLELIDLDRPDECCGFGGTFCVTDEEVSASMGKDKNADITRHGARYVVSTDMSCLMHLQGIARRNKTDLDFLHVAQVLNNGPFRVQASATIKTEYHATH
jgi:L-lactate dehydrogenase complex protein LldE